LNQLVCSEETETISNDPPKKDPRDKI
jgi:hypothetical protein